MQTGFKHHLLYFIFLLLTVVGFSQRGPGGVSIDSDQQKNCRLWLDAGDLTELADGDSVILWFDKSFSAVRDSAFRDPQQAHKYTYPLYRNAPSASINGKPVISFEYGGMLGIGKWPGGSPSTDLNSNANKVTTYEQTLFFAFRTSNDVSERQIIWEEGGAERGITIYIYNDDVYIGAFDINGNDADEGLGKVPGFGFTYKRLPIQANTTYVLAFKYDVNPNNTIIYNNTPTTVYTGLTGTLNGQPFPSLMEKGAGPGINCSGCATGVGGIFTHEDPIGIGGINQGSYHEQGRIYGGNASPPGSPQDVLKRNTYTGTHLFTGRLAEIVYYAYALNPARQIIVENYLAAKYFANVIANDKYIYESNYGDGVIGIGREQMSPPIEHNISQGDNLFEIRAPSMGSTFNTAPQYVMVGHNNAAVSWTKNNTPDTASIQRLRRIWRWDITGAPVGASKTIKLKLSPEDIAKLPPLPPGYTKYGVMLGNENQPLPNFTGEHGEVIEFLENTEHYFADVTVKKGTYLTLCAIKPVVQFRLSSDFAIEGNVGTDPKTAEIFLNYKPAATTTYQVEFSFMDGTATLNNDYTWTPAHSPITFSSSAKSKLISFSIVNDVTTVDDLPVETFSITLTSANNGLNIGAQHTLVYSIYDNDPPPKVSFEEANTYYNENAGLIQIPVKVIGELTGPATATIKYVAGSGTALRNKDFTLSSPQTLQFSPGNLTDYFTVNIIDDSIDEYDEYFTLRIINTSGELGFDNTLHIETNVHIIDNDLPPTVSFVSPASEGYRSISKPQIFVQLSSPSAKPVSVPFSIIGGTAINDAVSPGGDYSATPEGGDLIFAPGDSIKVLFQDVITSELHLIVYNGGEPKPDGVTVVFELGNDPVNTSTGTISQHIYTIRDYTEFEWKGIAGIGKHLDNTIWMVPDAATSGSDVPNLSPRNIQILQNNTNFTPLLTTREAGLNNKRLLQFDGVNDHLIPSSPGFNVAGQSELIQMSAFYDSKSMFFVIIPEKVNDPNPQVIFESGAQRAGMSVYIKNNSLYFNIWGWQDNKPQQGVWGLDPDNQFQGLSYTKYDGLVAGQPYIISCHYENAFNSPPIIAPVSLFVNGEKVDTYDGEVRRLQGNEGSASIGSVLWQTRFVETKYFTNTNGGNTVPSKNQNNISHPFKGKIGDFLYYNEPKMNEARVRIIHNYLSAKYKIALHASAQAFDLTYADNENTAVPSFNYQVAGIGKINDPGHNDHLHGDSQGESELRVRNAAFNSPSALLVWGNNGESLTDTWPVSSATLPPGIRERSAKVWRFMANPTTGVQKTDLHIRYSIAQNASAFSGNEDYLKLLVSTSPTDFSSSVVYDVSTIESGHIARFADIPITNGMYVTLANTSPIFPLPVELLNFDARLNGTAVDISWSTSSEHNNDYFVVERAGTDLKWEDLMQLPGAGNSNTLLKYFEKDRYPLPGMAYYRLKQVDYDGTYKYSDVVSVLNHMVESGDDIYLFPNPSSSTSVFIRIPYAVSKSPGRVSFYNLSGIKVREIETPQDATTIELRYGNLPAGVYFLQIENDFLQQVKKLVIQ